jgi:hypothetical protein
MNAAVADSLRALRAADPAAGVDVRAYAPTWAEIAAEIDAALDAGIGGIGDAAGTHGADFPRSARPARRPVRRWRPAIATLAAAAALVIVGVVAWPWSSGGPGSVAYGVTTRADGTVAVRVSATHPLPAAELQARLRAAGVPAVVLVQSVSCTEPAVAGLPLQQPVISYPGDIARAEGFAIEPTAIPARAVLLVELPPVTAGQPTAVGSSFAGLFVTLNAPGCVAPIPTTPPSPTVS